LPLRRRWAVRIKEAGAAGPHAVQEPSVRYAGTLPTLRTTVRRVVPAEHSADQVAPCAVEDAGHRRKKERMPERPSRWLQLRLSANLTCSPPGEVVSVSTHRPRLPPQQSPQRHPSILVQTPDTVERASEHWFARPLFGVSQVKPGSETFARPVIRSDRVLRRAGLFRRRACAPARSNSRPDGCVTSRAGLPSTRAQVCGPIESGFAPGSAPDGGRRQPPFSPRDATGDLRPRKVTVQVA
jgi:hypothetical protein